jgi:hypothetical protein
MKIKSIVFFITGSLLCTGLTIAQTQTGSVPQTPSPQTQSGSNYTGGNTSGMTQINTSALPDPLRSTLQDNQQYKGWESGQWYFNSTTNQYSVQMPGANPGVSTNPSSTPIGVPTNSLAPTNPIQGSTTSPATNPLGSPLTPATSTPASPVNPTNSAGATSPLSTTPATGMQLPSTQTSPSLTTPTWYRFDATGKLIPQPRDN